MIIGVFAHIPLLSGEIPRNGVRAAFPRWATRTLAANYFHLLAAGAAGGPVPGAGLPSDGSCCAVIVTAIVLTGFQTAGALVLVVTTRSRRPVSRWPRRRGAAPARHHRRRHSVLAVLTIGPRMCTFRASCPQAPGELAVAQRPRSAARRRAAALAAPSCRSPNGCTSLATNPIRQSDRAGRSRAFPGPPVRLTVKMAPRRLQCGPAGAGCARRGRPSYSSSSSSPSVAAGLPREPLRPDYAAILPAPRNCWAPP